jgi:hypothetical protein
VIVVRGTKKFLDRVGRPDTSYESSTSLGDWYANALFWRPQVALFVNAQTLFPVLVPLAPATSVVSRLPTAFGDLARRLGAGQASLDRELAGMAEHVLAKTASRSVLGVMNEFAHMAEHYYSERGTIDLVDVSMWLAQVPCSPLYGSHISPDRALLAALG